MRNIPRILFVAVLALACSGTSAMAAGGGPDLSGGLRDVSSTTLTPVGQKFTILIKAADGTVYLHVFCGKKYASQSTMRFTSLQLMKIRYSGGYTRHGCEVVVSAENNYQPIASQVIYDGQLS